MQGNLFYYSANVCGSIIGPNNRKCDGKAVNVLGTPGFSPNTKGRMYNSLFCQRAALGSGAMEIRNCVFPDTSTFRADDDTNDTVVLTAAANLALNEDGTPKIGVNPAVDAADLSLYDFDFSDASFNATDLKYAAKSMAFIDAWCRGAKDLNGNMRIANGRVDVGCFEADWLGQYAAILGGRCTVVSAPSNAVAEAGGSVVAIDDGEMAIAWGPSASSGATSRATNYTMHGRVTGTGDLSVIVNGETVATFGAAAGNLTIPFSSALAVNDVRFVYAAGENDEGGAELWGFSRSSGTAVIIR